MSHSVTADIDTTPTHELCPHVTPRSTTALRSPLGVVIVSYNTRALLQQCLESLRACTLPLNIVVVDNASPDGSAAMVREDYAHVRLVASETNRGFAAGTNEGLRALGSDKDEGNRAPDMTLVLNPDTVVQPGAIETLVAFLEAHPRVGVVAPQLRNPDGSRQNAAFRFPTVLMTLFDLFPPGETLPGRLYNSWWNGRYPQERDGYDEPFSIDHPLGACMLVRREAIAQAGVLDEGFFLYSEEVEWCWRIRAAGWAIWQEPRARVTHVGGASSRQVRRHSFIALYRSRLRFFRQHSGTSVVALHRSIIRLGMVRATLRDLRDYFQRHLSLDELRARLWAYSEVARL